MCQYRANCHSAAWLAFDISVFSSLTDTDCCTLPIVQCTCGCSVEDTLKWWWWWCLSPVHTIELSVSMFICTGYGRAVCHIWLYIPIYSGRQDDADVYKLYLVCVCVCVCVCYIILYFGANVPGASGGLRGLLLLVIHCHAAIPSKHMPTVRLIKRPYVKLTAEWQRRTTIYLYILSFVTYDCTVVW